jgi:long-subunit acyl-CoA synthetase (AMP-forming)
MSCEQWKNFWRDIFKESANPVAYRYVNGRAEIVSAANFWTLGLRRRHELRRLGVRSGEFLFTPAVGFELIIELIACAMGDYVLVPISERVREVVCDSGGVRSAWYAYGSECRRISCNLNSDEIAGDIAVVLYTSGTSGLPKAIGLTGSGIINQLICHAEYLKLQEGETRLCLLPHWHAFGFVLDLCLGLYARQTLLIEPAAATSIKLIEQLVHSEGVAHLAIVPRLLEMLVRKVAPQVCERLTIHVGGAPIRGQLRSRAQGMCSRLVEGYGLTECGPGVLLDGQPLGCDVEIRPMGTGHVLWVRGPSVSPWVELDEDGFFCTMDIICSEADGYRVVGRFGDNIKLSNGEWVSVAQLERDLIERTGVVSAKLARKAGKLIVRIVSDARAVEAVRSFMNIRLGDEVVIEEYHFDKHASSRLEQVPGKGYEALLQGNQPLVSEQM